MPTGIYKRSAKLLRDIRKNFQLGRTGKARKKATESLKRIAQNPKWRQMVSDVTTKAMRRTDVRVRHLKGLDRARKKYGVNFRGGNGQKSCEIVLKFKPALEAHGYVQECVILTRGHNTRLNCPNAYKVDFGRASTKEAIEFDGPCHRPLARRAIDLKKDTILKALGWTVTRIKHD